MSDNSALISFWACVILNNLETNPFFIWFWCILAIANFIVLVWEAHYDV